MASTTFLSHLASGSPRALVVGGGIAGLAAAYRLSRGGARVVLLEGSGGLGGRGATREEGGFSFNLGPHALYKRGEWKALLDEAGVAYEAGSPPVGGAVGIFGGEVVPMASTPFSIAASRFFTWRDKAQVLRCFGRLPRLEPSSLAGRTLASWLGETMSSPRARAFAEGFFRVSSYANAPDRVCAAAATRQAQRALGGVLYVAGGWSTLVEGLAARLRRDGALIETGAKVSRVLTSGGAGEGGVRGVELADGRFIEAEMVVLAVRPQTAARLLPDGTASALREGIAAMVPSAAACLDLALGRLPRPERLFALGFDQATYFSVHSAATRLAPAGRVLLHAARYLAPGEEPRRAAVEEDLEGMMDLLQPGWREEELHRQLLPRMVVQDSLPLAGAGRPGVGAAGISGLRLAGDWVDSPAFLADAAAESAGRAARELLGEAGIGEDLRRRTA